MVHNCLLNPLRQLLHGRQFDQIYTSIFDQIYSSIFGLTLTMSRSVDVWKNKLTNKLVDTIHGHMLTRQMLTR